jgi:hypothetical protein
MINRRQRNDVLNITHPYSFSPIFPFQIKVISDLLMNTSTILSRNKLKNNKMVIVLLQLKRAIAEYYSQLSVYSGKGQHLLKKRTSG